MQLSFCWSVLCRARTCVLLRTTPINWPSPPEWRNFLNYIYNAYSHKWHKNINMYTLNPMESNHRDGPISLSCYSTAILSLTCYGHGQYNSKNNNSFSTYCTLFQCFVFMWELHAPTFHFSTDVLLFVYQNQNKLLFKCCVWLNIILFQKLTQNKTTLLPKFFGFYHYEVCSIIIIIVKSLCQLFPYSVEILIFTCLSLTMFYHAHLNIILNSIWMDLKGKHYLMNMPRKVQLTKIMNLSSCFLRYVCVAQGLKLWVSP